MKGQKLLPFFTGVFTATASLLPIAATAQEMEEIIVTVERREESLQDFAGTALALDSDQLGMEGVDTISDLSQILPGFSVGEKEGNVLVFIRGVGSEDTTEMGDPGVATHFDGIYIPRTRGLTGAWHDIERLEVNVGPQGTLRGRNALGGTINIVYNKPDLDAVSGHIEMERGLYDLNSTQAAINLPLGDQLAARVALFSKDRASYYDNVGPVQGVDHAGRVDEQAYRVQLYFQPSDRFDALLSVDGNDSAGSGYPGTNLAFWVNNANVMDMGSAGVFYPFASDIDEDSLRDVIYGPQTPIEDSTHDGVKLDLNVHFDLFSMQVLASQRDLDYFQDIQTDRGVEFPEWFTTTRLPLGSLSPELNEYDRFTWEQDSDSDILEIRFYNEEGPFLWTAGLFGIEEEQFSFVGETSDRNAFYLGTQFNSKMDSQATSAYFDATWEFTDDMRISFGVRATEEEKQRNGIGILGAVNGVTDADGNAQRIGTPGFAWDPHGRTIFNPDINGDGTTTGQEAIFAFYNGIGTQGTLDNGVNIVLTDPSVVDFYAQPQTGSVDDDYTDGRIRFAWDITEDNMAYILAATGHTAPGFNDNVTSVLAPTYDSEALTMLEIGSKNVFDFGTINASLFYYDYQDKILQTQVSGLLGASFLGLEELVDDAGSNAGLSRPGGTVAFRFNVPESHIAGINVEGAFDLPADMTLSGNLLLMEAEVDEGRAIDGRYADFASMPNVDARRFREVGSGNIDTLTQTGRPGEYPTTTVPGTTTQQVIVEQDLKGRKLPRTPEVTLNLTLSQMIQLATGSLEWQVSTQYRDEHFLTIYNGEGYDQTLTELTGEIDVAPSLYDKVDAITTVNVGLAYNHGDTGDLRLELYGTNVTDEIYPTDLLVTAFTYLAWYNEPATWGVRMKVRF